MNHRVTRAVLACVATGLLISPAWAQSPNTWNGLSDRFQIDAGYFNLTADTLLSYNGPNGAGGEVSLEKDLGQDKTVNTFWVDGTWRVGRRHQLKLSYTRTSRDRANFTLQRDFTWGGQAYSAGLSATSTSGADIVGGYYRFAIVRNDRFEIGPAIGVGHLTMKAGIQATGTPSGGGASRTIDQSTTTGAITGAVGGYAQAWPAKKLSVQGDFLYIKVTPDNEQASVTDWRLAAYYYLFRSVGVGAQYKYNKYTQERTSLSTSLGGEMAFQGVQAFVSFKF